MLSPTVAAKIRSKDRHDVAALVVASLFSGVWYALADFASKHDAPQLDVLEFMALGLYGY